MTNGKRVVVIGNSFFKFNLPILAYQLNFPFLPDEPEMSLDISGSSGNFNEKAQFPSSRLAINLSTKIQTSRRP